MKRVCFHFDDVDQRNAMPGDWEKRYTRTSTAPFRANVVGVVGAGTLVVDDVLQGGLRFDGAAGRDSCYLMWCDGPDLRINGIDGWHRTLALVAPGTELDGASSSGARFHRLSFHGDLALRLLTDLQAAAPHVAAMARSGLHRPLVARAAGERFQRLLVEVTDDSGARAIGSSIGACEAVIEDTLYSVAQSLLFERPYARDVGGGDGNSRHRLCLRAEALVRDERDAPLTVGDMCRRLGCSERVLELAFREQFGVCPRQLMIALRLQRARRMLAEAGPGSKVTAVATQLGFWHLGRFSRYYRQMFGVLPGETLRRPFAAASAPAATGSVWGLAIDSLTERRYSGAA
jgi:AraC-like DNA-binding protein